MSAVMFLPLIQSSNISSTFSLLAHCFKDSSRDILRCLTVSGSLLLLGPVCVRQSKRSLVNQVHSFMGFHFGNLAKIPISLKYFMSNRGFCYLLSNLIGSALRLFSFSLFQFFPPQSLSLSVMASTLNGRVKKSSQKNRLASILPSDTGRGGPCLGSCALEGPPQPFCRCTSPPYPQHVYSRGKKSQGQGMCPLGICSPFFYIVLLAPKLPKLPVRPLPAVSQRPAQASSAHPSSFLKGSCGRSELSQA